MISPCSLSVAHCLDPWTHKLEITHCCLSCPFIFLPLFFLLYQIRAFTESWTTHPWGVLRVEPTILGCKSDSMETSLTAFSNWQVGVSGQGRGANTWGILWVELSVLGCKSYRQLERSIFFGRIGGVVYGFLLRETFCQAMIPFSDFVCSYVTHQINSVVRVAGGTHTHTHTLLLI